MYFGPDSDHPCAAIGVFQQKGELVTGTFITETGDYRFLEGVVDNDSMSLSTFDGSHAFFFKAGIDAEGKLFGRFRSGTHWNDRFAGHRNETFELRHPETLTILKDGHDEFAFSFPDLDSNMVSLNDPKYQNKVVVVEVMGSWCPNCMDGTSYLAGLHDRYNASGLEIVALAFERSTIFDEACKTVRKHKQDLNAHFDFLIAGKASKTVATEKLPMLTDILSFPTTIFIDRHGKVRKIYTGFYGPGTGMYYDQFHAETTAFVEQLLQEEI